MNFFTTSDNQAIQTNQSFDLGGGDFEPIPENTQLKVVIDEAKWDEYEGDRYISLRWMVIDGEFKSRKIFHKVRVLDGNTTKADKAKKMLAAIDSNAGGKLLSNGVMPDDMALGLNLTNKPMAVVVAIWEINDKKGNWIKAVSPLSAQQPSLQQAQQSSQAPAPMSNNYDDTIGF